MITRKWVCDMLRQSDMSHEVTYFLISSGTIGRRNIECLSSNRLYVRQTANTKKFYILDYNSKDCFIIHVTHVK
jgi:hypothetical protein